MACCRCLSGLTDETAASSFEKNRKVCGDVDWWIARFLAPPSAPTSCAPRSSATSYVPRWTSSACVWVGTFRITTLSKTGRLPQYLRLRPRMIWLFVSYSTRVYGPLPAPCDAGDESH